MKLKALMKTKDLTGYQLAKDSGVSYTVIKDLMRGDKRPENLAGKTIYALSKELGITMEEFIKLDTK